MPRKPNTVRHDILGSTGFHYLGNRPWGNKPAEVARPARLEGLRSLAGGGRGIERGLGRTGSAAVAAAAAFASTR